MQLHGKCMHDTLLATSGE